MAKRFNGIVIHCSESEFGTAQDIEDWHKERGWSDIGYHATISNGWIDKDRFVPFMDGQVEIGRDWNLNGAHAKGYNDYFGLCFIGVKSFSVAQLDAALKVCRYIIKEHGVMVEDIIGHYECENNGGKTCPNFDVSELRNLLLSDKEVFYG